MSDPTLKRKMPQNRYGTPEVTPEVTEVADVAVRVSMQGSQAKRVTRS